MVECKVRVLSAELSVYLHFVWQPGVRRQGDFKCYFRPKEEDIISVFNILTLAK